MDFDALYLKVLKYLNYRPRSEKEIRDYLKKKLAGFPTRSTLSKKENLRHSEQSEESYSTKGEDPSTALRFPDSGLPSPPKVLGSSPVAKGRTQDDNSNLIDVVVYKLKAQKFLNDAEFARMWVRSRTSYKPKGERLVRLELQQKGISKDIIDEVFQQPEVRVQTDVELAVEILEKKRKKYERMEWQERFNKAGSMLARRGYGLDTIRKAIDQVFGK